MTLVTIEGFDYYTSANIAGKGWSYTGSNSDLSMVGGRFGGQALRMLSSGGGGQVLSRTLPSTATTMVMGIAHRPDSTSTDIRLLTAAGANVASIRRSGNNLQVLNAAGASVATGTADVHSGYHYYELKVFVSGASGTCELHVDGVLDIASTTGNFGSTAIGGVLLGFTSGGGNAYDYDDIYFLSTSGATNNNFLGDVRVTTQYPDADGVHTQWQATGGGAHYTQVNEHPFNGDTTYVSDANPGDLDTYSVGDVDGGASVFGVQTTLTARKDDANTRQIAPVVRQAGTDYVGTTVTLSAGYVFFSQLYDQDPTGSNWTPANYNADEFGVKEIA